MATDNDEFGTFLAEYSFDDGIYVIEIKARSWAEAEQRLKRIGAFGRLIGSDATRVPASLGWFARLFVWWRNYWRAA